MTDLVLMVMGGAVLGLWVLGLLAWGITASFRRLSTRTRPAPVTMSVSRRRTRPSVRPRLFNQDESGRYRVVG
jgi:hypothetical protein